MQPGYSTRGESRRRRRRSTPSSSRAQPLQSGELQAKLSTENVQRFSTSTQQQGIAKYQLQNIREEGYQDADRERFRSVQAAHEDVESLSAVATYDLLMQEPSQQTYIRDAPANAPRRESLWVGPMERLLSIGTSDKPFPLYEKEEMRHLGIRSGDKNSVEPREAALARMMASIEHVDPPTHFSLSSSSGTGVCTTV